MKIMFYNIAYGTGMNGSWKRYFVDVWRFFWLPYGIIRKMIKTLKQEKPDVLCLVEVDGGSFRNRFRCQARYLARRLLYPFYYSRAKYGRWSIWRFMAMVRKQHDAILSRKGGKLRRHLLKSGVQKLVHEFVVDGISIFSVHLSVLSKKIRQRQLRELAEVLKKCPRPHLVCGDFNTNKGLAEIREFIKKTGLRHVIKKPTYPSISPSYYLDMFFASPGVKIKRAGVLNVTHSDHLPVWVELK